MPAPKRIIDLVNSFKENLAEYKSSKYNETQVRQQFIDPFFEELGWDMQNKDNLPEAFREVMLEDSLKIEGRTKAPDYAFRLNGQRIFFVEAKKPAVHLEIDKKPAFQVRRYGWSAGLNVCLLTDFEEFVVFDTRIKPNIKDKASVSRIQMYRFTDYIEKWDEIYNLFSKQAIINNSLAKLVQSRKTRGIQKIDDDFLKQMEKWREVLAKEIRFKNKAIITTEKDLNFAVQSTIDRILFLRIAEDNNMEEKGNLQRMAGSKGGYKTFMQFCRSNADVKYNSGLFHFADKREGNFVDTITPKIEIGDRTFKKIIDDLYYPNPYAFDAIENDILGSVYEQFLGKVIKLSNGKVEEKPEVRKAGGVYYTPKYIVDYIVKNTIGEWLKGKTPKQAEKLTVCDPACGSGSFLSVAYKFLLDWNLKEYLKDTKKYKKKLVQTSANDFRLSLEEKKTILTNNIYGVDIDHQAVEVAKLSLLLKVLEGESGASLKGKDKHILPDLSSNIKCGNSLIGTDFYAEQELSFEEKEKVNCFDWKTEFPHIFKNNGFDCVIGNPPYVNAINLNEMYPKERNYLSSSESYKTLFQKWDLYIPFVEKGLKLLQKDGYTSMIIPYPFVNQIYAKKLREEIITNYSLVNIVDLSKQKIFKDATVTNCIYIVKNSKSKKSINVSLIENLKIYKSHKIKKTDIVANEDSKIWNLTTEKKVSLKYKQQTFLSLSNYVYISKGMVLNAHEKKAKGKFKKSDLISKTKTEVFNQKYISARDISNYKIKNHYWLEWNTKRIPSLLSRPTFPELYIKPKILVNKIGNITATFDKEKYFCDQTIRVLILWKELKGVKNKSIEASVKRYNKGVNRKTLEKNSTSISCSFLLGILNSKIASYFLKQIRGAGNIDINPEYLRKLPIPKLDLSKKEDKTNHDKMVKLVEQMLALKKQEQTISPTQKQTVQREIKAIDNHIDSLTYKLYNLTESEIKIIEGE